jgi:hypothetical protein
MLTFCTWCVLLLFYDILSIWFITFGSPGKAKNQQGVGKLP